MPNDQDAGKAWTGRPLRRLEDADFLDGTARYLDDLDAPGALAGVVVRAAVSHAAILGIEIAEAAAMPGVRAVFTGADLSAARRPHLPLDVPPPAGVDQGWQPSLQPVLALDRVRFAGEGIAFVVADTRAEALAAAECVELIHEEHPAIVDLDQPAGPRAIEDAYPDNRALGFVRGDAAATDAAFAAAARHVGLAVANNRIHASPLETRSCLATHDRQSGRYELQVGTQRPYDLHRLLVRLFRCPPDSLRVAVPRTGGGFGLKNGLYPEYVLCLHAAEALGCQVKWVAERSEGMLCDNHSRDNLFALEAALDAGGAITALRANRTVSLGAYTAPRTMVPVDNGTPHLTGAYAIPAAFATVEARLTNTACTSSYRGAGRPEWVHACERFIDYLARGQGLDPIAYRRRHLLPSRDAATALGAHYPSADLAGLLDDALARADHAGFPARRAQSLAGGRWRGMGVALFVEDLHGSQRPAPAAVTFQEGRPTLDVGTVSVGHGHETVFRQIAADILHLDPDEIGFRQGDTAFIVDGLGTAASWSLTLGGSSVLLAAEEAVRRARDIAARDLELAAGDLVLGGDGFRAAGTDLVRSWRDIAALEPGFRAGAVFDDHGQNAPSGCHVCEIEVDPETGAAEILAYVIVQDCGRVLNPMVVAGQLHGGTVQGIGQAAGEAVVYDRASGQLLTGSLMDYAMPRAADLTFFDVAFRPTEESGNPLGVRGVGEAGATGATACYANAVLDALAPAGILHLDIPLTPDKVWTAIRNAGLR